MLNKSILKKKPIWKKSLAVLISIVYFSAFIPAAVFAVGLETLPKAVDNSMLKYFPPIGNQGGTYACGNFAIDYYVSTYMTALARDIDVKAIGDSAIFSPGFSYETNAPTDRLKASSVTLDKWPWNEEATVCSKPAPVQLWREAFQNRAESSLRIDDPYTAESQILIKQYLAEKYVFVMSTYIGGWEEHIINDNLNSTLDDTEVGKKICTFPLGDMIADHMMTLVGYNDDIWFDRNGNGRVEADELGAYKIANSWGTEYGNEGFMWLAYADASAMWGYVETYIFSAEKHTPKLLAEFEITGPNEYFSGFLGWAPHGSTEIIFLETSYIFHRIPTEKCTILADFSDVITEYNLNLKTDQYDFYLRLEPIYFGEVETLSNTITSYVLTDADGNKLVEYDGKLPVTIVGTNSVDLKITFGQTESDRNNMPRDNMLIWLLLGAALLAALIVIVVIIFWKKKKGIQQRTQLNAK